ncbi:MAG: hypothetical protein J7K73_03785 [Nanoarchaeota archaeon]|nr:hypothetical protein [Nanoarchaeota archaeon]
METILVGEKETKDYLEEAKKVFENANEVLIRGVGRDTVKAVDVAELLKADGFKVSNISINTEEKDGKRVSFIEITLSK